jgi:hypothetical protein
LDVQEGKLQVLQTEDHRDVHPVIPLGSTGEMFGTDYTVIGFMERYALYQKDVFPWTEYLIYSPEKGFRWLVCNDKHWSFVESISPHGIADWHSQVTYQNDEFRLYDRGTAYVRSVRGEFYWKVRQGDRVKTADFICPPRMISIEKTLDGPTEELNASLGIYVPVEEIEKAFGLKDLRRPWGVGVIQPAVPIHVGIYFVWFGFIFFIAVVHVIAGSFVSPTGWLKQAPDGMMAFLAIFLVSSVPLLLLVLKYNFEVTRWKDSDYSPYASE